MSQSVSASADIAAPVETNEKTTTMKFTIATPTFTAPAISDETELQPAFNAVTTADMNIEDAPLAAAPSKRSRRSKRNKAAAQAPIVSSEYRDFLEQAEICREQARNAARMKRWKAARGLFDTAIGLCQRALGLRPGSDERNEAQEYLQQLTMEVSTYSELANSKERPFVGHATTTSSFDLLRHKMG